jgi:heme o synthase
MLADKTNSTFLSLSFIKLKAFNQLLKFRLTMLVVFSAAIAYVMASHQPLNWGLFFLFIVAGTCITAASNILNQVIEKDTDKLMSRTMHRPLPTGVMSVHEALFIAFVLTISGMYLFIEFFNLNAALLSFLSLVLYAFAYTPMKTKSPIAVFIGAIPGALPPMIGWVAMTNHYGLEPGILFAIQLVWQFPHFWAIAWVLDEDYKKAGIKLLPAGGAKDIKTAFNIMAYTLPLVPLGFMPYLLGMTGITSAIIAVVSGILFLIQTFLLMRDCSRKSAKFIMFGSFIYLPVVQIAFLLDKVAK